MVGRSAVKMFVMSSVILSILMIALCRTSGAADEVRLSRGQTLYVPVYSHVVSGPKASPFNLATILSIRNADMSNSIAIIAADYYDTKGKLLRKY